VRRGLEVAGRIENDVWLRPDRVAGRCQAGETGEKEDDSMEHHGLP